MNQSKQPHKKILIDVDRSGQLTQMKVYQTLKNTGWENIQCNEYYMDRDENKFQQIDIDAYTNQTNYIDDMSLVVGLHLIIKIKRSLNNPWVVFTTELSILEKAMGAGRIMNSSGLKGPDITEALELYQKGDVEKLEGQVGRSYLQAFKKEKGSDQEIICGLNSCVKAAEHMRETQKNYIGSLGDENALAIYEPLIVLEGQLFEATLDKAQNVVLRECPYLCISFNYVAPHYGQSHRHAYIVTLEGLPSYLKNRMSLLERLERFTAARLKKNIKKEEGDIYG